MTDSQMNRPGAMGHPRSKDDVTGNGVETAGSE